MAKCSPRHPKPGVPHCDPAGQPAGVTRSTANIAGTRSSTYLKLKRAVGAALSSGERYHVETGKKPERAGKAWRGLRAGACFPSGPRKEGSNPKASDRLTSNADDAKQALTLN